MKIDFMGIGTPRAGTTWIFHCLKTHPQICMSLVKETYFFHEFLKVQSRHKGLEFYRRYFRHCTPDKVIGEFTPHYLTDPDAPRLIKDFFPDIKLIVSLRNPVERLYSLFNFWNVRGKHDIATFEEFIDREKKDAVCTNYYHKYLANYLELFPEENILILIYEDIARDPQAFIKTVYRFLGVEQDFVPNQLHKAINVGKDHRGWILSRGAYRVIRTIEGCPWGRKTIDRLMTSRVRALYDAVMDRSSSGTQQKPSRPLIKDETRRELLKLYEEDILKLERLLGRSLDFWR
ncbi:sulfotransferase [Thermodesulfobacteriota bacterium]